MNNSRQRRFTVVSQPAVVACRHRISGGVILTVGVAWQPSLLRQNARRSAMPGGSQPPGAGETPGQFPARR